MQKLNSKIVKPRCVTARLVSVDRMDNELNGNFKFMFGLAFGKAICYRIVCSKFIGKLNNATSGIAVHSYRYSENEWFGNHVIIESCIGKPVWILLDPEPKLYFYADSIPLTLIKPNLSGNDHLSLLVTRSAHVFDRCHEDSATPRYIVEHRLGIVSVLDTQHPDYEEFFTVMSDLPWVVASWVRHAYGVAKECFTWQVKKAEHLAELLNSTGANQFPDYGLADMCGELQEQRRQLLAARQAIAMVEQQINGDSNEQ